MHLFSQEVFIEGLWVPVTAVVWVLWVPRCMRHGLGSVRSHSLMREAVSWEECEGRMNYRVRWKPWKLSGGIVWAECILRDRSERSRSRETVSEVGQGRRGLLTMCRGPRIKKMWPLGSTWSRLLSPEGKVLVYECGEYELKERGLG